MLEQAARNKARNPSAKVFHYRNIVKALPWFEEVREKLVQEFGTESQKKKAAKARKVADIIGSGHGGQDLRKKVMAHHYG